MSIWTRTIFEFIYALTCILLIPFDGANTMKIPSQLVYLKTIYCFKKSFKCFSLKCFRSASGKFSDRFQTYEKDNGLLTGHRINALENSPSSNSEVTTICTSTDLPVQTNVCIWSKLLVYRLNTDFCLYSVCIFFNFSKIWTLNSEQTDSDHFLD